MKSILILMASLIFTNVAGAYENIDLNSKLKSSLDAKVIKNIEQNIQNAYFEYDRSWILEEVVVIGKRTANDKTASNSDTLGPNEPSVWEFSVSF